MHIHNRTRHRPKHRLRHRTVAGADSRYSPLFEPSAIFLFSWGGEYSPSASQGLGRGLLNNPGCKPSAVRARRLYLVRGDRVPGEFTGRLDRSIAKGARAQHGPRPRPQALLPPPQENQANLALKSQPRDQRSNSTTPYAKKTTAE